MHVRYEFAVGLPRMVKFSDGTSNGVFDGTSNGVFDADNTTDTVTTVVGAVAFGITNENVNELPLLVVVRLDTGAAAARVVEAAKSVVSPDVGLASTNRGDTVHTTVSPRRTNVWPVTALWQANVDAVVGVFTTVNETAACVNSADPVAMRPRTENDEPAVAGAVTVNCIVIPFDPPTSVMADSDVPPTINGVPKSAASAGITPDESRTVMVHTVTSPARTSRECETEPAQATVEAVVG